MISETCSVCGTTFDVMFRYQMEERDGGFAFYCSHGCLEKSQKGESGAVTCDACMKRFSPDLVSQILYVGGQRKYACSLDCRGQLKREAQGARLGEFASPAKSASRPAAPQPLTSSTAVSKVAAPPAVQPATAQTATLQTANLQTATPASAKIPVQSAAAPASVPPAPPSIPSAPASVPSAASAPSPLSGPGSARSAATRATARTRKDEAPPPTRTSGLHAAIRPQEESAIGNDAPGVVIPVTPPLKGEKSHNEVKSTLPRRIAVFNHKGGTGKTTTAVSVAAGLAARGKRVLLVDTDAQGNVSVSLGAGSERSLYHVLVMGLRVSDAVKEVRPNLHLLPSNETLAAAELYLAGRQNRDRVLSDRLSAAAADYDYVVLDCSPSLSLMNQNALVLADSVLVPVACDYLSLVGVRQVLKTVKNVNSLLHHPVQIWGVLPTFFDSRAKICNEAVATLKDHFGDKCLPPIRAAIKVKEAPSVGQTIYEYAAGSNAADDYNVIVDRIIGNAAASSGTDTSRDHQQVGQPVQATA